MDSPTPTKQCLQRLQKELRALQKDPSNDFVAAPDPQNILIWWVRITGPPDTCYAGGYYLSQLRFPGDYPFKPPSIKMCTPNGRFKTDTYICLSNSSFHPEEWSPMWSISTIVTGMISFFVTEEKAMGTMTASESERKNYAKASRAYNVRRLASFYKRSLPEAYAEDLRFVEGEENGRKHLSVHENTEDKDESRKKEVRLCEKGNQCNSDGKLSSPVNNHEEIESVISSTRGSGNVLATSSHSSSDQISLDTINNLSSDTVTLRWRNMAIVAVFVAVALCLFCCIRGH